MELGATLAVVARITLAAAFGFSAVTKLLNQARFTRALAEFGVPRSEFLAPGLPAVEVALAVLLVTVRDGAWPAFAAIAVLALFTGAVIANLVSGAPKPCPCFGPPAADAPPVSAATVARNGYLLGLGVIATGSTDGASAATALAAAAVTATLTLLALRRFG